MPRCAKPCRTPSRRARDEKAPFCETGCVFPRIRLVQAYERPIEGHVCATPPANAEVARSSLLVMSKRGAFTWPLMARAQQSAMPVIGFLRPSTAAGSEPLLEAFRQGLNELGYVEGQNVTIEYRWAQGQEDRLPALVADLVRRQVAVIVASTSNAAIAAKDATPSIPIVFVMAVDPVEAKLVESLNRPAGNITGVTILAPAPSSARTTSATSSTANPNRVDASTGPASFGSG